MAWITKVVDFIFPVQFSTFLIQIYLNALRDRQYKARRVILNTKGFEYKPTEHLYYDSNGLLHFKKDVRNYYVTEILKFFQNRNEDLQDMPMLNEQ